MVMFVSSIDLPCSKGQLAVHVALCVLPRVGPGPALLFTVDGDYRWSSWSYATRGDRIPLL